MDDQQLVQLLADKRPSELTEAEIQEIRTRLAASRSLRHAVANELNLESSLVELLGRDEAAMDQFLAAAENARGGNTKSGRGWSIGVALLILLLLGGGIYVGVFVANQNGEQVADNTEAETADDPSESEDDPENPPQDPNKNDHDPEEVPPINITEWPTTISAADFSSGNLSVDREEFGTDAQPLLRSQESPAFVEYNLDVQSDGGNKQLRLEIASFDSRPVELIFNGESLGFVAGEQTGGHDVNHLQWINARQLPFKEGENTLKLQSNGNFPHLSRLEIGGVAQVAVADNGDPPKDPTENPKDLTDPETEEPAGPPWSEVLAANPPPPFAKIAYRKFDLANPPLEAETKEYFATVPGVRSIIAERSSRGVVSGAVEGIVKLIPTLPADGGIKVRLESAGGLKIHFFHKEEGVTLVYNEARNLAWGAYQTAREGDAPAPTKYLLAASDNLRNYRTGSRFGGSLMMRYEPNAKDAGPGGHVQLWRGDVLLVSAPISAAPEEIYFEGSALIQGVSVVRAKDWPQGETTPLATKDLKPSDLIWELAEHPNTQFKKNGDGSVFLETDKDAPAAFASAIFKDLRLNEIILEFKDVSPETAFYLGAQGEPRIPLLQFKKSSDGKEFTAIPHHFGFNDHRNSRFIHEEAQPIFEPDRVLMKIVVAPQCVRTYLGRDGQHWAEFPPARYETKELDTIVLHSPGGGEPRKISLASIKLRRLTALREVAKPNLLAKAVAPQDIDGFNGWTEAVIKARPEGSLDEWLTACAIASLEKGSYSGGFQDQLVRHLADEIANREMPLEKKIAALDDLSLLIDGFNQHDLHDRMIEAYWTAGKLTGEEKPYSAIRKAVMIAPINSAAGLDIVEPDLISAELAHDFYTSENLYERTEVFDYFNLLETAPLGKWIHAVAAQQAGEPYGMRPTEITSWRTTFREELDKPTYNLLAELRAAVRGEAWKDVADMLSRLDISGADGLAPAGEDRDLLSSLQSASQLFVEEHPELREAIDAEFDQISRLRMRTAINLGDEMMVRQTMVQFPGTAAAAIGNAWLGDRATTLGHFDDAFWHYEAALAIEDGQSASEQTNLAMKQRLAAALAGKDFGSPAKAAVQLGEVTMPAAEFEQMIKQLVDRHQASGVKAPPAVSVPKPSFVEATGNKRLFDQIGSEQHREYRSGTRKEDVDWVARQTASVIHNDMLYIGNRFELVAVEPNGNIKWRARDGSQNHHAQYLPQMQTQPLIRGEQIFVRQITNRGPSLAAFTLANGNKEWSTYRNDDDNRWILSDPFFAGDRLLCVTGKLRELDFEVAISTFDPKSGEELSTNNFAEYDKLKDNKIDEERMHCVASRVENDLVVSMPGMIARVSQQGKVRWLRKTKTLPPLQDALVRRHPEAPIFADGKITLLVPDTPELVSLDADTGSLLWSKVMVDAERIIAATPERLVVQRRDAIVAINPATGEPLWRTNVDTPLWASAVDARYLLIGQRKKKDDKPRAHLLWLDSATGKRIGGVMIEKLPDHEKPMLGPIWFFKDRTFVSWGRGFEDPHREFYELKFGDALPVSSELEGWEK